MQSLAFRPMVGISCQGSEIKDLQQWSDSNWSALLLESLSSQGPTLSKFPLNYILIIPWLRGFVKSGADAEFGHLA